MKALSEVTKDALDLPPQQRVTLARILLDSSEAASPEIESAWEDEICRRIQAVQNGTAKSRSMEDVFADLDRKFPA